MKSVTTPVLLMFAGLLAGCGSGDSPGNSAAGSSGPASAAQKPSGNASAEEVARAARGKVKCPAPVRTAARAEGAAVDDVLGVRPGMTWEEAANVVLCTNDLMVVNVDTTQRFNIKTYGQTLRQGFAARHAEPHVVKDSRQIMKEMQDDMMARSGNAVREDMKPGQSKWYVSTMGLPGEERVIAAAREEWFAEGKSPTVTSVEEALKKKYGTPAKQTRTGPRSDLVWSYDPRGRPISETSPLYNQCHGSADPDGGSNFSPDCGLVVVAAVVRTRENPELAQYFQVGVIDQAHGYEAITGTEQALQQLDAKRRAQEVESASKNADAPQL